MLDYKVLVHYHNPTGDYFSYDMWQWQINQWGKEAAFSKLDYFGIQGGIIISNLGALRSRSCDYQTFRLV